MSLFQVIKLSWRVLESPGEPSLCGNDVCISGAKMSLIVKAGCDLEDIGHAFVRRDDGFQVSQLFVVSEVSDPVGAAGGRQRDVPLHRGVTLPVRTLQPVKPAARGLVRKP